MTDETKTPEIPEKSLGERFADSYGLAAARREEIVPLLDAFVEFVQGSPTDDGPPPDPYPPCEPEEAPDPALAVGESILAARRRIIDAGAGSEPFVLRVAPEGNLFLQSFRDVLATAGADDVEDLARTLAGEVEKAICDDGESLTAPDLESCEYAFREILVPILDRVTNAEIRAGAANSALEKRTGLLRRACYEINETGEWVRFKIDEIGPIFGKAKEDPGQAELAKGYADVDDFARQHGLDLGATIVGTVDDVKTIRPEDGVDRFEVYDPDWVWIRAARDFEEGEAIVFQLRDSTIPDAAKSFLVTFSEKVLSKSVVGVFTFHDAGGVDVESVRFRYASSVLRVGPKDAHGREAATLADLYAHYKPKEDELRSLVEEGGSDADG